MWLWYAPKLHTHRITYWSFACFCCYGHVADFVVVVVGGKYCNNGFPFQKTENVRLNRKKVTGTVSHALMITRGVPKVFFSDL